MKSWLSKDEMEMITHQMEIKEFTTSLAIREMKIRTTLRFQFIPVKMMIMKKTNSNKCW